MGDLFDDFMKELERRRAEAEGRTPPSDPKADDDAEASDGEAEPAPRDTGDPGTSGPREADGEGPEPTPIRRSGARAKTGSGSGTPPRRPAKERPPGGADDGARPPSIGTIFRRVGLGAVVVVIALVVFLAGTGIDLWTDAIWYRSVGFDSVFWTRLSAQIGLFAVGLAVALVVLLFNLWLAGRLAPPADPEKPGRIRQVADRLTEAQRQAERAARMAGGGPAARGPGGPFPRGESTVGGFDLDDIPNLVPLATWIIAGVVVLIALGIAGSVSGAWETLALWINRVPFSPAGEVVDPVFGRDISFFLFDLPFFRTAQSLFNGLLLASLVVVGARYLVQATQGGEVFITRVRVHVAVIAGLYLLSVAFGYQLDKYELVYSTSGAAVGVGYTDAGARFMAYDVLTFLSGLAGALLIAGAFTRWMWPLGAIVIIWFSASLVLGRLYPEAIQRLTVDPNEFAQEERYIANNIAMTQVAFGLDRWEPRSYAGTAPLTQAALEAESDTFTNARLWDYRPLQTTLDQLQTVRQYYDFVDVDTDRYTIEGELRQVMLSGRELAIERNPQASSWVNQRIIYTHGIGLAMVPVNEVTQEGQPQLWVRDLPPASSSGAPAIVQPRLYFGEADNHYVVTGARQPEFDIPGDGTGADLTYNWTGTTGIKLDSVLSKLLFSLRFRDFDLLISDQITVDSQLLFHRTINDRMPRIAPFLRFDKDPYLVVDDRGHLVYIQDAYTTSDAFPHSTWFDPGELDPKSGLAGDYLNYIRNSVKVTMDAYDGTMTFYISDEADPLIRAWQGVFPQLFRPLSELPGDLRDNLRVPEELFNVQTRMYGQYHVTQPLTWFNNTDRWTVPAPQTNEQSLPPEAYYVVMRMPGEPKAEFLLLQPMIAQNRPNMIAWVAARNDPASYGQVRAYRFPSDTTIFGPAQIESRIDQDPIISSQVTLWDQAGSDVIRGNLIVVPVGESLLYLQPVYLQSTSAAFPEFQKIIVASPTTIVWGDSLREALIALLEKQGALTPSPSPSPTPTPGPSATPGPTATPGTGGELPGDVAGLVDYANTHFELAQAALRAGDFATYGVEMDKVETALARLGELTGTPVPSVAP
ncbi:MAG TPA: UPF0182 family protein [Candidatus Limnocylindrales bacterium]|nr:UPF0182 family protein [Candidatus Limnocylindrales bacterium]